MVVKQIIRGGKRMHGRRKTVIRRIATAWPVVLVCWFMMGCQQVLDQPAEDVPSPPTPSTDPIPVLERKNDALSSSLSSSRKQIGRLEEEIAQLKIQAWEYEAMINDLRIRSVNQQKRLDAAIIDVVRAKAKLRSLESKADAASTIAEAEIAVKTLKTRAASPDEIAVEEIATAEQLLEMSTKEFKSENFGGALYLANQTKGQVQAAQMRLSGEESRNTLEGETVFAQPLPLRVLKNSSNLRQGPGLDQKIAARLDKDELLIGYSFKDNWIRVETQAGVTGWIFQSLVGPR